MIVSTQKSCESWAKNKAKELGGFNRISFGKTHASFIKEGKDGNFSATQIRYPKSVLGFSGKLLIKGILIGFWALLGGGIGFIAGDYLFGENLGRIIIIFIGLIIGGFWGFKSS